MDENEVLVLVDELRQSVKNVYAHSRLVRLDKALSEGDCKGVALELEILHDCSVAMMLKLIECQNAVSEVRYNGGFSYAWQKQAA